VRPFAAKLDPRFVGQALYLLNAGGYDRATREMLMDSPLDVVALRLGGPSRRSRKTVLELIELAMDDVA
jgi:hypothetical protein